MKLSKQEYIEYASQAQPKSPHLKNLVIAFILGGFICVLGQGLTNLYQYFGLSLENSAMATSVTLIAAAALLTGLGLYEKFGKIAGAGSLVPITGFSNAVVSAALEFKSEGFVVGMCANMFKLAGPVLVMGISASILYGLICLILI